jgi:threonine dehydrogenase-like Zn-dependent dehydrogenase
MDGERLVLGHESFGEVIEAPRHSGFKTGDRVVGIVRRPDPVPCPACAAGEWDMCSNGRFTERGIKARHGFGADRFRIEPEFAVKVDPGLDVLGVLLEPASIVAKAWDHIERIGRRSHSWQPHRLLVTGAGAIGLLAALLGRQRGLEVHVFDRNESGPKPALVRDLGGHYHCGSIADVKLEPDVVIECTGAAAVIAPLFGRTARNGIMCLVGLGARREFPFDVGVFNRELVLNNEVLFGSVNANRAHYQAAGQALARADRSWLRRLISRHVPLDRFAEALDHQPGDIKVVIDFAR